MLNASLHIILAFSFARRSYRLQKLVCFSYFYYTFSSKFITQHRCLCHKQLFKLEADPAMTRLIWPTPAIFLSLADCEKLHVWKTGSGDVTQGKPGIVSMACAAGHCSRENPALLTYAATMILRSAWRLMMMMMMMKRDTDLSLCFVTLTFGLLTPK